MADSKLYLEPELDLRQLSEAVGLSVHHLSQLINQYKGETFYDYINRLRVEHFKQAVLDPQNDHLSMLGLAFDFGFNSKTAFNTTFKRYIGMTPTEFKKRESLA
jgi:AraC-like DNA-binding protein